MTAAEAAATLPLDALAVWLRLHVRNFDGPLQVTPLTGGQSNPTYRVHAGPHRWVLWRKPSGELLASAHAIEREYRVMQALAGTDVPVPTMHALCEDAAVIGASFYVMDFVEGRVFADPALPGSSNAERADIYDAMNSVIAALHRVAPQAIGLGACRAWGRARVDPENGLSLGAKRRHTVGYGEHLQRRISPFSGSTRRAGEIFSAWRRCRLVVWLGHTHSRRLARHRNSPRRGPDPKPDRLPADYGRPTNYLARQIERWTRQYRASETARIEAMERLIDWLPAHRPEGATGDESALVHGDFRIDNLIFHPTEPRVLAALGIPLEHDYLAAYGRRTGRQARPMAEAGWRQVQRIQGA